MDNSFDIKFGADTSGLEKGVENAKDAVKKLDENIEDIGKSVKKTSNGFDNLFKEGTKGFEALDTFTGGWAEEVLDLGKVLSKAFKIGVAGARALKIALVATGIGAVIVLLGLLLAYWKEIRGAIIGISPELDKQIERLKDQAVEQQHIVDLLNASDNILKLQGKSQIQINNLKIKELTTLFEIKKANLDVLKTQLEGAKTQEKVYRDLATKLIGFAIAPIKAIALAIDKLSGGATNLGDKVDELAVSFTKLVTPDLTNDLIDEFKALELETTKIENTIAGLKLSNIDLAPQIREVDLKPLEGLKKGFMGLEGISDIPIPGLEDLPNKLQTAIKKSDDILANWDIKARAEVISLALEDLNESASNIIENGLTDTFAQLGEVIGESLASGGNIIEGAGQVILGAVGSLLTSLGKMAIQIGVGLIAVKLALKSLNPAVAIAGGIALVALGAVFSKGAKSLGSSGGSGSGGSGASSSSGGGRGSGGTVNYGSGGSSGGFGSVVFEIAGTKLVGVLSKTLKENSALSGKLKID